MCGSMNKDLIIQTVGLTCRFGDFTAVDHLALNVPRGCVYGFIGSNGSGKSTAIRMLCGLLRPSEGHAYVMGCDTAKEPDKVKQRLGYMSQKFSLYLDLTAEENLDFYAGLYGLRGEKKRQRIEDILSLMKLTDKRHVLSGGFSGGQKQRLALGCALLHRPELLILDEPTSAVDPTSRRLFWNLISDLASDGKTTILVTTHFMDEAEHCDLIGFLQAGRLIAEGSPDALKKSIPGRLMTLQFPTPEEAEKALAASGLPALEAYTFGREYRVLFPKDTAIPDSLRAKPGALTMEDVLFIMIRKWGNSARAILSVSRGRRLWEK